MKTMVIEINEGVIQSIYSNAAEAVYHLIVIDEDDEGDEERNVRYRSIKYLLQKGDFYDIENGDNVVVDGNVPVLDPEAFTLVTDDNQAKTANGRHRQELDAAFIAGYLTAHTEISKGQNMAVCSLNECIDKQIEHYCRMVEELNQSAKYDL